jgi:hypothetical protein
MELNYRGEASTDLNAWSSIGVEQEAETLGLFTTATLEDSDSEPRFLRLIISK